MGVKRVDLGRPLMAFTVKLGRELAPLVLTDRCLIVFSYRFSKSRLLPLPVVGEVAKFIDLKAAAELSKLEGEELTRALEERGFDKVVGWIPYSDVRRVEVSKGLLGSTKLRVVTAKGDVKLRIDTFFKGLSVDEQVSRLVNKLRELGVTVVEKR